MTDQDATEQSAEVEGLVRLASEACEAVGLSPRWCEELGNVLGQRLAARDADLTARLREVERERDEALDNARTAWAVHREHVDKMGPIIARHAGDATFEKLRADKAEAERDRLLSPGRDATGLTYGDRTAWNDLCGRWREAEARAEAAEATVAGLRERVAKAEAALRELVTLKDGPRDAEYERRRPLAWDAARALLADAPVGSTATATLAHLAAADARYCALHKWCDHNTSQCPGRLAGEYSAGEVRALLETESACPNGRDWCKGPGSPGHCDPCALLADAVGETEGEGR